MGLQVVHVPCIVVYSIGNNMIKFYLKKNKGYALLYTVIISSIIMTTSIGLSNSVTKELILASVARDSQQAFYQADIGTECGLYLQFVKPTFLTSSDVFTCGLNTDGESVVFTIKVIDEMNKIYNVTPNNILSGPCFNIYMDGTNPTPESLIESRGYNQCDASVANRVERALDVYY